ncbi:MAG: HNH endonuclease signature motif containing protein [Oceanibaculum nanhaiense]|uniref:HNH endonuclease n=1 Tax=Oceanibaculum nanhaiense TaxID=1909734 RepID=UPI0032EEFBC0
MIISDHTTGLYQDRWEGDVLHYTGMGRVGDQALNWQQNRTLAESNQNGVTVHLFERFPGTAYIYAGEVDLVGAPYQETQADDNNQPRQVWMFPVRLRQGGAQAVPSTDAWKKADDAREKKAGERSIEQLLLLAMTAGAEPPAQPPARREAVTVVYNRNPYVAAYVKQVANGRCDLCRQPAPFTVGGEPYLHCHHVQWLSRGGADIVQNAVALCPNCHCKMHALNRPADVRRLLARIRERDPWAEA